MDERDVGIKKSQVNVKEKLGKEKENSNKIIGQNQVPQNNKEWKSDAKERRSKFLDERDENQQ